MCPDPGQALLVGERPPRAGASTSGQDLLLPALDTWQGPWGGSLMSRPVSLELQGGGPAVHRMTLARVTSAVGPAAPPELLCAWAGKKTVSGGRQRRRVDGAG